MSLNEHTLFASPENWKDIENWIEAHNAADRVHLYTVVYMFNNLIVNTAVKHKAIKLGAFTFKAFDSFS